MKARLSHIFTFEASHRLDHLGSAHPCYPLHGHSYKVKITVEGEVDPATGFLIDYADLARIVSPVIRQLDHTHLNDVPDLGYATAENICRWVWVRLTPTLPTLLRVSIQETDMTECDYEGK